MIVFLTLCYVGALVILVHVGIVRLNLWWKLSPLVWVLILLLVLFVPMQWGAPAGTAQFYQPVIEIIPNVSGEVLEVPAKPLIPMQRGDTVFVIDPEPYEAKVEQIQANLSLAQVNLERAKKLVKVQSAAKVDVDRYEAELRAYQAQLKEARWNLEKTVVKAPTDGYLIGLTLQPGQRVSSLSVRSWAAYVDTQQSRFIVGIPQSRLRHIEPGQKVEIALRLRPGEVLEGRVSAIAPMTPQGQLQPTGTIPTAPTGQDPALPFGVVIEFDETLPPGVYGGAMGTAAIFTENSKLTHLIRKVMLRMEAWTNYLAPA